MSVIEPNISTFIEAQFPAFYREEGELFVLFAKEYYKWLEENYVELTLVDSSNFNVGDTVTQTYATGIIESKNGNTILVKITSGGFRCNVLCLNDVTEVTSSSGGVSYITKVVSTNYTYHSRHLFDYTDIDRTTNKFIVYFKEKYLKNIQFDITTSKKMLIKAANDLYSSKGTQRSIDLLFKMVFGVPADVYYPGDDVLQLSSGKWVIPRYLEVTPSPRNITFTSKTIYGTISGAEAFCESIVQRNIKGKIIDVIYLSNIKGSFKTGEIVVDDNKSIIDAPRITGSLSDIFITSGGEGFSLGEPLNIVSERGAGAKGYVSETVAETGLVRFELVDGGWGYSNTANVLVSEKVYDIGNLQNSNNLITTFNIFETVSQNLLSIHVNNAIGTITASDILYNPDGNYGVITGVNQDIDSNTATIVVNSLYGNVVSNNVLRSANSILITIKANTSTVGNYNKGELIYQSNGSSNVSFGYINSISNTVLLNVNTSTIAANGIHPGVYLKQSSTLATGRVGALPWSSYSSYNNIPSLVVSNYTGTFSNTDPINIYSNSSYSTVISSFTPTLATNTETLLIKGATGSRWYPGNTVYGYFSGEINSILMSSDVGGVVTSTLDVTAYANVIGINSTSIGVYDIHNTFYTTTNNKIVGKYSNTTGTLLNISTGFNAAASIHEIVDTEQIRVNPDFLSGNNDGYASNTIPYANLILTGVNSTYGFMLKVLVEDGGAGYDNTNIVIFSGGNTGSGSYGAGNSAIITDDSGIILNVLLANSGNGYTSNPTVTIANSSGGNTGIGAGAVITPLFPLGFTKLIYGTLSTNLVDILQFETKNIGSIASLFKINPGENYNKKPFVVAYERDVAEYNKKDFIVNIKNLNKIFNVGEQVYQYIGDTGTSLSCNLYSGSSSILNNDFIYSTDGINTVAAGEKYSYVANISSNSFTVLLSNTTGSFNNTITTSLLRLTSGRNFNIGNKVIQGSSNGIILSKNTTHVVVKDVNGVFNSNSTYVTSNNGGNSSIVSANNNYKSYQLFCYNSNNVFNIVNTSSIATSFVTRGIITSSNSTILKIKRLSFFNEFSPSVNNDLIGVITSANAGIQSVSYDTTTNAVGLNANITSNVVTTNGSIKSIHLTDSGFSYENDEGVVIYSLDNQRESYGKASVNTSGTGEGFYSSRNGFTSDIKKIFDGNYYQEYSYEVQSPIPLDKYKNMLLEVLHVAGTVLFGKVNTISLVNNNIEVVSSKIVLS